MKSQRLVLRNRAKFVATACTLLLWGSCEITFAFAASTEAANALPRDPRLDEEAAERIALMPSVDIAALDRNGAPTVLTVVKGVWRLERPVAKSGEADVRKAAAALLLTQGYEPADLLLRKQWVDELGHLNLTFDQTLAGLPVVGGEVRVHFDPEGNLQSLSGPMRKAAHSRLSVVPIVALEVARASSVERTDAQTKQAEGGRLVFLNSTRTGEIVLAWEVKVTGRSPGQPVCDLIYTDARTGIEIERHALIHSAKNRQNFDANQTWTWGTLARPEGAPPVADADVNANYTFMGGCLRLLLADV